MVTQQLIDYVKQQIQQGVSQEIITNNLISQGWQQLDVNEAFYQSSAQNFSTQTNPSFDVGDAKRNKRASLGIVFGIMGFFQGGAMVKIGPIGPITGVAVSIVGLIFGIRSLKSQKQGFAIAGIALSSIALFGCIASLLVGGKVHRAGKADDINQAVQKAKSSLSLPYRINAGTTLVDIKAKPSAILHEYVLVSGFNTGNATNDSIKNELKPKVCQDETLKSNLNKGINLEYSYSVENSTQTYFASFTKTDCE